MNAEEAQRRRRRWWWGNAGLWLALIGMLALRGPRAETLWDWVVGVTSGMLFWLVAAGSKKIGYWEGVHATLTERTDKV